MQLVSVNDQLLSNVSNKLVPAGFICEQLFALLSVTQNTGKIGTYGKQHLRIVNTLAGGTAEYRRVKGEAVSDTSFSVDKHGLESLMVEEDYRNYLLPFDAEADRVDEMTTNLYVEKEKSLADALANTSTLTQNTTLSGTQQFSDKVNSDPLAVVAAGKAAIRTGCGLAASVQNEAAMWCDYDVAEALRFHPQILDSLGFKEARPGGLSDEELARAFKVKRFIVAESVYNSAVEGQSDSVANCWGKHLWIGILPTEAKRRQISLGYRLQIAGKQPRRVFRTNHGRPPESVLLQTDDSYAQLIMNAGAAYLIKDAIA